MKTVRCYSDRIRIGFGLNFHMFGSDFVLFSSDRILSLFSRIGSDFLLILSVWKKPNNQKSVKFNEKASQTMRGKLKGQSANPAPRVIRRYVFCRRVCHALARIDRSATKKQLIRVSNYRSFKFACHAWHPTVRKSAVICIYILFILECFHVHVLLNTKVLFIF